mmetsp:Transcript_121749/g.289470  ORF Transcript_121749/g.289470 Transcript_121749/m.289470 type:complete len:205 (-) Transcript_121749:794-1408(-)
MRLWRGPPNAGRPGAAAVEIRRHARRRGGRPLRRPGPAGSSGQSWRLRGGGVLPSPCLHIGAWGAGWSDGTIHALGGAGPRLPGARLACGGTPIWCPATVGSSSGGRNSWLMGAGGLHGAADWRECARAVALLPPVRAPTARLPATGRPRSELQRSHLPGARVGRMLSSGRRLAGGARLMLRAWRRHVRWQLSGEGPVPIVHLR